MAIITISFEDNEEPHEFIISRASARAVWTLLSKHNLPYSNKYEEGFAKGRKDIQELLKRGYSSEVVQKLTMKQIDKILKVKE